MTAPHLENLNPAQERAVTHAPTSLQILAGPGSGKTRVLTCRVAYLVRNLGIQPEDLVVVTFTNKAANEMKHRLCQLLGPTDTYRLVIGTFHSMAVQYLRKYGSRLHLSSNWVIADRGNQLSYAKEILKDPAVEASIQNIKVQVNANGLVEQISKMKSKGISPREAEMEAENVPYKKIISGLYGQYQRALRDDNALDFDDLLLYGERLFQGFPDTIANVKHVLIDEFQDTNLVQYDIMKLLAGKGAVTIVGDPDQGIYGWRSAEIANLKKMTVDFPKTTQIFLEENYRSSSAILKASLAVVEQDKDRIDKSLFTSHPALTTPVLRPFAKPTDESNYIAQEVKRLIAHSGGMLNFNDFAVLLRFNALSRSIEMALTNAGIPCRMVGGSKFFDRAEVKDILAYLQLADNPSFSPAFDRVINTPRRGIGPVTVKEIKATATSRKMTVFEVCRRAAGNQDIAGIKPAQRKMLKGLVDAVLTVRQMAKDGATVASMIDTVVDKVGFRKHLADAHGPDADTRYKNIEELQTYATQVANSGESSNQADNSQAGSVAAPIPPVEATEPVQEDPEYLAALEAIGDEAPDVPDPVDDDETPTALRSFLVDSILSTDADTQAREELTIPKVTLTTCHSAKGLEWPVVFIPSVENGTFPMFRCHEEDEIKEERRLLFVAMTRAQAFLYMSYCHERMMGAESRPKALSQFVTSLAIQTKKTDKEPVIVSNFEPSLTIPIRASLAALIGRPAVEKDIVADAVKAYSATSPNTFPIPEPSTKSNSSFGRSRSWGSGMFNSSQSSRGSYGSFSKGGGRQWGGSSGSPPSASQPTGGAYGSSSTPAATWSNALNMHRGATASQPVAPAAPLSYTRPSAQAPTAPVPATANRVSAAQMGSLPEARLSRGAESAFLEQNAGPAKSQPSIKSFQSTSKGFLTGIKDGLPADDNDELPPAPGFEVPIPGPSQGAIAPGTFQCIKPKSKAKRLGTGRPPANPPAKKAKTTGTTVIEID